MRFFDEVDDYIREGRFQRSLSLIAGISGLLGGLEVTYEHYRGSYSQRIMYSPLLISFSLFGVGIWGAFSRKAARTVLPIVSLVLLLDGCIGFIFHIRGIARKPGGWRIPVFNVIMGPPIFAPLLLATSGFLGIIASLLRREDDPEALTGLLRRPGPRPTWEKALPWTITKEILTLDQDVREGRFQRILAVATAISILFSGVEALYSHYANNFRYWVQWTPILLTPILFIAGFGTVWSRRIARTLLPFVSALALLDGMVGTFYHARGIIRRPGGLKHPVYNLMYGPPIFAPMLLSASGFLGLLASLLRRRK